MITMSRLMELEKERYLDSLDPDSGHGQDPWLEKWARVTWEQIQGASSRLRPVPPYVIVQDIPQGEEVRDSGLILPGTKREQDLTRAIVMSTPKGDIPLRNRQGKLVGSRECQVREGDICLYEKHRGTDIQIQGEVFVLLDEAMIVGVLEG